MNTSQLIKERIKNVMINDRSKNIDSVIKMLRSDTFTLLCDYFCVEPQDLKITLEQHADTYELTIKAEVTRILENGNTIE